MFTNRNANKTGNDRSRCNSKRRQCFPVKMLVILSLVLAFTAGVSATGVGDVEVRLNGCANMAFIDSPNILEIWIMNDAPLQGMCIGFKIDISVSYSFNMTYGNSPPVNEEGDAIGAWNLGGLMNNNDINNVSPDHICFGGAALGLGLPTHDPDHSLCYTMEFTIPAGVSPMQDGVCISPHCCPPACNWTFSDGGGSYSPTFHGNVTTCANPALPVCFDVIPRCEADGDFDNNGIPLTLADKTALIKYLHYCEPAPAPQFLYKADLYGDGIIDLQDLVVFENYFASGMGAFVCGYPVPTTCYCIPHKAPCIWATFPPKYTLNVNKATYILVHYDAKLDPTSVTSSNFVVWLTQGGKVKGNITALGYTAEFVPNSHFDVGKWVNVCLHAGIKSEYGVETRYKYQWWFRIKTTKGKGIFSPGAFSTAGGNVSAIVNADFDGDGDLDFVTAFKETGHISCMLNDGNGQYTLNGIHPVGFSGAGSGKEKNVVATDFDNDDDVDIVVITGGDDIDSSAFALMVNDGNGNFTTAGIYPVVYDGLEHGTPSLTTLDFNSDGYFDLVAAVGDYTADSAAIIFYENGGGGVFYATGVHPVGYTGASSGKPPSIVYGDFNSDGDVDVVMALGNYAPDSAALVSYDNDGDGTFCVTGVHPVGYTGASSGKPASIAGDINADGNLDVVMVMDNYTVDSAAIISFVNDGNGVLYATGVHPVGYTGASSGKPAGIIGDFDADGDLDVVAHFSDSDSITTFSNDSSGVFYVTGVHPVGYSGASSGKPAMVTGDFDDDGSLDIVVADLACDSVAVMFNPDYVPGDADGNDIIEISDAVYLVAYIFLSGPAPDPLEAGDDDCNGIVEVSDVVYLINYIFNDGPPPGDCDSKPLSKNSVPGSPHSATVRLTENTEAFAEVVIESNADIAGIQFEFEPGSTAAEEIIPHKTTRSKDLELFYGVKDGALMVGLIDLTGKHTLPIGNGAVIALELKNGSPADVKLTNVVLVDRDARNMAVTIEQIEKMPHLPTQFSLEQNYPNPFNPSTEISYALPEAAQVRLMIFNVLGQTVNTLVNSHQAPGYYQVQWDGTDHTGNAVPSGVYFYRLSAEEFVDAKKMLLLK